MNKIKDLFDNLYYERKRILIFLFILFTVLSYFLFNAEKTVAFEEEEEDVEKIEVKEAPVKEETKVMVDIKGEVNKPGCYEADENLRVQDIIELAGGLKEGASTDDINLSSKIFDEMVIVINKKEEVVDKVETNPKVSVNSANQSSTVNKVVPGKVSINTAGVEELSTLNGIKEARAKKIIEYRETNGPFKALEDIKNVSGIGESIFAKIKDSITL